MSLRVFVTGATGYLGGAIAQRLARAGHDVFGMTRNTERGAPLAAAGIQPVFGDLDQPDSFIATLKNCDAAVHAAIDDGAAAVRDQQALETFRHAAEDGRLRRLLYTSGIWVHGDTEGRLIDESSPIAPLELVRWRAAHEDVAVDLAAYDVVTTILRPAIVYGESRGMIGAMFAEAQRQRTVTYAGDGHQHWPLCHRDDVAEGYALALEHGGGERFLLGDESRHTLREIAEAIARVSGAEARPTARERVLEEQGAFGEALLCDQTVSALKARRDLGWVPRHASLVAEAEALHREWQSFKGTPVV
ncbi:MAG TPA: NAD-dependent epimerase/dehydratase family protein [Candidatus Udaeobacter sp.]|jgi:nucleoside-diphosphate-sugar epimerase|nr:NAD-dependent epimerase/dehydratase family protein [Candidatus Udaeobacter sp.]